MERVVVTGIGLVTPVGLTRETTFQALLEGKSGIGPITRFDTTAFRVKIAAEVRDFDPAAHISVKKRKEMDRFTEFAVVAAKEALLDSGLPLDTDEQREETGCFIGVGLGGLHSLEKTKETLLDKGPGRISPYSIPSIIANLAAGQVSMLFGIKGPNYCVTSACSSGAHAIGEAYEWIRRGKIRAMVAGGAEATITPVGIGGFEAMMALSKRNDDPTRASRPFDKGRDGFVSGEGAGVLVLESLSSALARGAKIYCEITGYGASSDANHLTQPSPNGEGAQRAMKMAIREAGVQTSDIGYVNAHGTSTPVGDVAETQAIEAVFGEYAHNGLWVSSTKSMMGHLLGAAGAVESAICALSLQSGKIAPTINLDDPDPACTLDYVPHTARERTLNHVLNNSFGFGGTNCSLLFSRVLR